MWIVNQNVRGCVNHFDSTTCNATPLDKTKYTVSQCRIIPCSVSYQTLRNMRQQKRVFMLCGKVAHCDECGQMFTTTELV